MKGRAKNLIQNARISVKLAVFYMMLLLISWGMIFLVFYHINYKNTMESASAISIQALNTVSKNISTLIGQVAYDSRIILSSSDVIKSLASCDEIKEREALHQFVSLVDEQTNINGIYIWDMQNQCSSIDRKNVRDLRTGDVTKTSWYQEVRDLSGSYCLKVNADRVLTRSSSDTAVSLIRVINNSIDFEAVGIMMINIDLYAFEKSYVGLDEKSVSDIYILDETNKIVASRADIPLPECMEILKNKNSAEAYLERNGRNVLISEQDIDELGWKVVTGVPIGNTFANSGVGRVIFVAAIFFLTLFSASSYLLIRRYVAEPLEEMAASMNRMSGKKFEKIRDDGTGSSSFAEMGILKNTYNKMVDEIDVLIDRVYEEEKIKRKAELNALQEQMKPHFLYNTIDAMSYLALSGKNEELYDALEAFGSYYRTLLSKGREIITVREELEMVKDYLDLQRLRYGDTLHYVLEADEKIQRMFILKMVLQPIVENSVNHGIRPKGKPGVIYVEGKEENGYIKFTVEDDGVGMEEADIEALQNENLSTNEKSFGFRGTIERLRIFYDNKADYEIQSEKGRGTTVILKIPVRYEGEEIND